MKGIHTLQPSKDRKVRVVHIAHINPILVPCGLRAFTLLLYLNDVAAGGETVFTKLANVSVAPRKGAAVLWANVDDRDDPLATCDDRTFHEARPIDAGVKQAANIWFHTHDFRTPYRLGCTG